MEEGGGGECSQGVGDLDLLGRGLSQTAIPLVPEHVGGDWSHVHHTALAYTLSPEAIAHLARLDCLTTDSMAYALNLHGLPASQR